MKKNCINVAIVVAGTLLILATPSRAQIASSVDEHGKLVFVNRDSPSPRHGSTISLDALGLPRPLFSTTETSTSPPDRLDCIVSSAAERHKVDPALVKAVIGAESGWNPRATSPKGAMGLMQLIPSTAKRYGGGNLYDPAQNVEAGTMYLKSLLNRYNGDLTKSLAAYNAGERAVDNNGGVPPYWETQRYVQKVTDAYFRPGSGRDPKLWSAPKPPVRKEVDSKGRVVFTNE
jgi:soluble lytic murein transglycosylase-like protein